MGAMNEAYDAGFAAAARWAMRMDLCSDMDSLAYQATRERAVGRLSIPDNRDAGGVRTVDRAAQPEHTTQEDYEHFLAYSGLPDEPMIRYAYFHGADNGIERPYFDREEQGRDVRCVYDQDAIDALIAERDGWKQQVMDELTANLAFRKAGAANPDEDMPTFCARLIAERDALRAELGELHMHVKRRDEYATTKAAETLEAVKECAAMREDAERYRWLRNGSGDSPYSPYVCGVHGAPLWGDGWLAGEHLDTAIDEAMKVGSGNA